MFVIRAAMRKMRLGKATGPGSLSVELLEALEDFGIDKITTLFNKNEWHQTSPDPYSSHECDLDGMDSFMSHITKILLSTITMRFGNKIKPEIAEKQCEG